MLVCYKVSVFTISFTQTLYSEDLLLRLQKTSQKMLDSFTTPLSCIYDNTLHSWDAQMSPTTLGDPLISNRMHSFPTDWNESDGDGGKSRAMDFLHCLHSG